MMADKNTKFYDIELCIRLVRAEILNEKIKE